MSQRFLNLVQLYDRGIPVFGSIDQTGPPVFESERDYLARLAFLSADE